MVLNVTLFYPRVDERLLFRVIGIHLNDFGLLSIFADFDFALVA